MRESEDRLAKYRGRFMSKLVREHDDRPIPDSWEITPLRKICPRCGRMGTIFVDTKYNGRLKMAIIWDGESRCGMKSDRDRGLTLIDIFNPTFGCGYDDHD